MKILVFCIGLDPILQISYAFIEKGDQIKVDGKGGICSTHGEMRHECNILVGEPEEKRPLERSKCRGKINIRIDLREIGRGVVNWVQVVHDRD
jgi:hypothetical protein